MRRPTRPPPQPLPSDEGPAYADYQYDKRSNRVFYGVPAGGRGPSRAVYAVDLSTEQSRDFYTVPEGALVDFKVAPAGEALAVNYLIKKLDVAPSESNFYQETIPDDPSALGSPRRGSYVYYNRILRLIAVDGSEIAALDHVWDYSWSPDGSNIAYTTFEYQGHYAEPKLTGTFIYDLAAKTTSKVFEAGKFVSWASFDGNLYIWDFPPPSGLGEVVRYNVAARSVEPTEHHSIYFSPTGRYYYRPESVNGNGEVYMRQTDQSVSRSSSALGFPPRVDPVAWAPTADLLLLFNSRGDPATQKVRVYDPDRDKAVEVSPDTVAWGAGASEVLVAPGKNIALRKVPAIP